MDLPNNKSCPLNFHVLELEIGLPRSNFIYFLKSFLSVLKNFIRNQTEKRARNIVPQQKHAAVPVRTGLRCSIFSCCSDSVRGLEIIAGPDPVRSEISFFAGTSLVRFEISADRFWSVDP